MKKQEPNSEKNNVVSEDITRLPQGRKKIRFNIRTGYVFVNPDDIVFCSADSNYTHITFTNQKQLTVSLTLSNVMESLPSAVFTRISRSTIININFLSEIKRTERLCLLTAENKVFSFRISPRNIKVLVNSFDM